MKPRNIFADHMCTLAAIYPVACIIRRRFGITQRRDIVGQRIKPDVDHLACIVWHGDAPTLGPRLRARDAKIVQAAADKAEHFALARLRHNLQLIRLDQLLQFICITRQAKEVILFFHHVWPRAVDRTETVRQFTFFIKLFTAHTV